MAELTQARVKALFNYDEATGLLYWKERPRSDFKSDVAWKITNKQRAGKLAGGAATFGKNVYLVVRIDNVLYLQHRIVWLMLTGAFPDGLLDHWSGDGTNNRRSNLREASYSQNHANRAYQGRTKSGLKGAYYIKKNGRWTSKIGVDKRYIHLGCFATAEEAHEAYSAAAQKYFGDFHRRA